MSSKMFGFTLKSLVCAAFAGVAMTGSMAFAAEEAQKLNVGGVDGPGGSIKGKVTITGEKITRTKIDMAADAVCAKAHGDTPPLTEFVVTGDGDALQDVFVYVVTKASKGAPIVAKPELDQTGCKYVPHVQGVVVGQELVILNNDPTLHNVRLSSKNNGESNDSMPTKGMTLKKKFAKPEALQFKCDVHPWMTGYVHVLDHPYFAVTQKDGTFEIKGLPAGDYEVKVWHEELSAKSKFTLKAEKDSAKVSVADGKAAEANFNYVAGKKAAP